MIKLIITRLIQAVFVLFFVSVIVFSVIHLAPGDPAILKLGKSALDPRNKEALELIRSQMGLDKPVVYQYFIWLKDVLRGDFGVSLRSGLKVFDLVTEKIPVSLELVFASLFIGILFSVPISVFQAVNYWSKLDNTFYVLGIFGMSIPIFWFGLMLITIFSAKLGWLPSGGHVDFFTNPVQNLSLLIMPAVSIGVFETAVFSRFLRADLVEVLTEDYIKTAKAKGLSNFRVVIKHGLRNSLISFLTVLGMEFGLLLGNIVVVEQVFGWPGIGWLIFNAIQNRDYAVVQGVVLFICFVVVIVNLLVDIGYYLLNPQFREQLVKK